MSILDNVKNLFGFTPSQPAPAVNATEEPAGPVAETPKPAPQGPPPAGLRRDQLLRFIVDKLRPYQNEPETTPSGFKLCIVPENGEEEELYRVALWDSQPGKFQKEVSRQLADNYIKLPKVWRFEYTFYSELLPDCTYREGNLGLLVLDDSKPTGPPKGARVSALVGQTEQTDYTLDPKQKTMFCIGRGHSVQTTTGRVRTNDIVILNDDDPAFTAEKGRGNGAVSRSHASIRYDVAHQRYALLVDPGGLPSSGNKTKIFHPDDTIERADIPGMGYPLQHGDQIELGGEVVLLFELI